MSFIKNYISEDDYNDMLEMYEPTVLENVNEENFWQIVNFLKQEKINDIKSIVILYFNLFLLDINDFKKQYFKLKEKYSDINQNLDILEEFYE